MNKMFVEDLIQLIRENPDMEVMCKVDSDIVADDGYAWWLGKINTRFKPEIEEFSTAFEERVIFKKDDDYTDWIEEFFDTTDFADVPDDEWDEFAKKKVDKVANWQKAIFISITVE